MFEKRRIADNKAFKALAINDIGSLAANATKNEQFALSGQLRNLLSELDSTPLTASKSLPFFYVAIRRYCLDIEDDLRAKNYHTAQTRMKDFEKVVNELSSLANREKMATSRKASKANAAVEGRLEKFAKKSKIKIKKDFSPAKVSIDTIYPAETLAELRLAGLQDRLDRTEAELDALRDSDDYNSALVKSQKQMKKQEMGIINQLIAIANQVNFREHEVELIKSASEEVKKEYAYQTKKLNKEQEEILAEWESVKAKFHLGDNAQNTLGQQAEDDIEEKVYEYEKSVARIDKEVDKIDEQIKGILEKVSDLGEDMEDANGHEKELIAEQIKRLKADWNLKQRKKNILVQRSATLQSALSIYQTTGMLNELDEKYGAIDDAELDRMAREAQAAEEKILKGNETLDRAAGYANRLNNVEVETDNLADVQAGASSAINEAEEFLKYAKGQTN